VCACFYIFIQTNLVPVHLNLVHLNLQVDPADGSVVRELLKLPLLSSIVPHTAAVCNGPAASGASYFMQTHVSTMP